MNHYGMYLMKSGGTNNINNKHGDSSTKKSWYNGNLIWITIYQPKFPRAKLVDHMCLDYSRYIELLNDQQTQLTGHHLV